MISGIKDSVMEMDEVEYGCKYTAHWILVVIVLYVDLVKDTETYTCDKTAYNNLDDHQQVAG